MVLCRGDREEIRIKMVHPSLGEKHLYLESVDTHNVVVDSLTPAAVLCTISKNFKHNFSCIPLILGWKTHENKWEKMPSPELRSAAEAAAGEVSVYCDKPPTQFSEATAAAVKELRLWIREILLISALSRPLPNTNDSVDDIAFMRFSVSFASKSMIFSPATVWSAAVMRPGSEGVCSRNQSLSSLYTLHLETKEHWSEPSLSLLASLLKTELTWIIFAQYDICFLCNATGCDWYQPGYQHQYSSLNEFGVIIKPSHNLISYAASNLKSIKMWQ